MYRLYWFGDVDHAVKSLWNDSKLSCFWQMPLVNHDYYTMLPLIEPDILENFLLERLVLHIEDHSISEKDAEIWNYWKSNIERSDSLSEESFSEVIRNGWLFFLNRLLTNHSLILYAQRNYINRCFRDFNQLVDLQDTNTPWDWDHIYPQSWVYYQQSIDDRTKRWEWRNGNFRAMSLTDNRSENNNSSPASRFTQPDEDYFINNNDLVYWSKLTDEHKYIKYWDEEYVLIHAKAIIIRSVNIYREFYDTLGHSD